MAFSSEGGELTIDDLPDNVLEHVFVLAGQRFHPAIAGVSKRWWRVCWGSRQLWRDIAITHGNPGSPIATSATGPRLVSPESLQQRAENFKAAQRALLARVGRCAEVFTCHDDAFEACIPLSAVLSQLSPAALIDLDLQVPELYTEQAHQLAGFSGLTSLGIHARYGCHGLDATLRQLPRLQWLSLASHSMGDELAATLQTLSTLTRLDLGSAELPSLRGLTELQQLRHLSVNKWDLDWPSDQPAQLPAPARFAALQSYNSSGAYVYGGLQLGEFRFQQLAFLPLPSAAGGPAAESSRQGQPAAPQPGTLRIDGCLAELDALEVAVEEAPADEAPPLPPFNALLEAALPLRCTLRQLVLECCALGAVSLQHLPVLAGLHCLQVRQCWGDGSMDGPLQALVQRAPALTSLIFDTQMPEEQHQLAYRLRTWPAYLLAHPSLRSAALLNRDEARWDLEQATLPSAVSAHSVLEELETDSCASVPPQLAAATSLTGLRFVTTSDAAQFELTASGLDALLALPRLTLLSLPRLSEGGQRAAEQLRSAQPGLHVLMIPD